jgi:hypothetical protein
LYQDGFYTLPRLTGDYLAVQEGKVKRRVTGKDIGESHYVMTQV